MSLSSLFDMSGLGAPVKRRAKKQRKPKKRRGIYTVASRDDDLTYSQGTTPVTELDPFADDKPRAPRQPKPAKQPRPAPAVPQAPAIPLTPLATDAGPLSPEDVKAVKAIQDKVVKGIAGYLKLYAVGTLAQKTLPLWDQNRGGIYTGQTESEMGNGTAASRDYDLSREFRNAAFAILMSGGKSSPNPSGSKSALEQQIYETIKNDYFHLTDSSKQHGDLFFKDQEFAKHLIQIREAANAEIAGKLGAGDLKEKVVADILAGKQAVEDTINNLIGASFSAKSAAQSVIAAVDKSAVSKYMGMLPKRPEGWTPQTAPSFTQQLASQMARNATEAWIKEKTKQYTPPPRIPGAEVAPPKSDKTGYAPYKPLPDFIPTDALDYNALYPGLVAAIEKYGPMGIPGSGGDVPQFNAPGFDTGTPPAAPSQYPPTPKYQVAGLSGIEVSSPDMLRIAALGVLGFLGYMILRKK